MIHRFSLLLALLVLALAPARAADTTATPAPADKPKSRFEQYEAAGVKLTRGPVTVKLKDIAELKVPEGFAFVGDEGLAKFYEITQNNRNGQEAGVLLAPSDWSLFFDYNASGYVKDDEKTELDADKLMKTMTANEDEINTERQKRGWEAMKTVGWATKPHYDEQTHNLKWAVNLSTSGDNFKSVFINESIRLLGRGGVMEVTLVCGTEQFKASEVAADQLLAGSFGYVSGQKYSEWKAGDKIAAYGLGALVLGGAGVMAGKAGLFAKLGVFFAKFLKVIVVGVAALGAFFVKLWKKITGRT
jgi:uncharacterized membrane-anchored protein